MNKTNILYSVFAAVGAVGAALSVVMLVMAIRFGELGRVVLYFFTAAVCTELAIFSLIKLFQKNKDKEQ